jgi:uracil-DNA glycosylase
MQVKIEESWGELLKDEFNKPYFAQLTDFVRQSYAKNIVYPPASKIFQAFNQCPVSKAKVVIIGQDPYHGPGQANGLCFSVEPGVKPPPSLQNIYKEIESDLKRPSITFNTGDLNTWAKQGVLLLNATLTVEASKPGSHQKKGWEIFTDRVISLLAENKENLVFILWGAFAQKKADLPFVDQHFILKAPHPSPFSVHKGFYGCKHFSKCNAFLLSKNLEPINW